MQPPPKNLSQLQMRRIKRILIKTFWIIIPLIILWVIIRIFFTAPLLDNVSFSRAYYDQNGHLLRITLAADDKYRIYTPIDKISPHIVDAIVLYEDQHFYHHIGINPASMIRAARQYIAGNPHPVGASTITMQVARIKYDIPSKTIWGKLHQIAAAIYIDLFHTKQEIIEAYLNLAPYGGNIEGIGAASTIYFDKPAEKLTKLESITLATIPQNPTKRGLNTRAGIGNIEKMRANLVNRWVETHPNDTNLYTLIEMPLNVRDLHNLPFYTPHFIDNMNTRRMPKYKSEIRTTIDLPLQTKMEQALQREISARKSIGINNAAAILVNYKTMETVAYIGSADYFNREIYGENDGVRARRSPGSTLKPLIYAAASDMGLIHGMTLLGDTKINFGVYAPENSDNDFYGPILARDALTHSRNIPAINLVRKIGVKNFHNLLRNSGLGNMRAPEHYGISIALGGAEVSMFELAEIYATMANLGEHRRVKMDMDDDNTVINHLLSPEAFFITLDMLSHQSVPRTKIPFTKNKQIDIKHYWKTGTSSSYRDAWTAGIFGDFVLIVWVGNFDGTPNNAFSGARAAAPIYFAMARTVSDYYASIGTPVKNNNFLRPDLNIISIDMCEIGGGIAGPYCPKKSPGYFIPGKSPITRNTVHQMIAIDNKTGLRACHTDPKTTHNAVYEFWDPEYLDMFRRAGVRRKTAPAFMPGCSIEDTINDTATPIIISPLPDTNIVITSDQDFEEIGFTAICVSDKSKITWFLNDNTLGTTKYGESLKYNVPMGDYILRAVDTNGAITEIKFSVIK